jgi:uncharacterized repeat protein (TIGR03803 family)
VSFGNQPATSVSVLSPTNIGTVTPPSSAGVVNVVVTNADGQSATLANGFTYLTSDPAWAVTSLHSFGPVNGANPVAGLVQGSDGNFYGTTRNDGTNASYYGYYWGYGTVFKISTNGVLTTLYAFGTVTNANGYALAACRT